MRWKTPPLKVYPRKDDKRTRHVFAIFPCKAVDGFTYWLCWVTFYEEYYCPFYDGHWNTITIKKGKL